MTRLVLINEQTMVCENVSTDPRPASEIVVPGYLVLDSDHVMNYGWKLDEATQEYVLFEIGFGQGSIGDTYENGSLYQPKLELVQPPTSGIQEDSLVEETN